MPPRDAMFPAPIGDQEEIPLRGDGQEWVITWHPPAAVPAGKPHGSAGICVTPDGQVVLISADGKDWSLPAGRPEGAETWEQTLCREMREEACAVVRRAQLLGFSRGRCFRGHEAGLVLVRALWRADVELLPWDPQFEIAHRRVVPMAELFAHMTGDEAYRRTTRRALVEAGLAPPIT